MTTAAIRVLGVLAPPPLSQLELTAAAGGGAAAGVMACTPRATMRGDAAGIFGVEVPTI